MTTLKTIITTLAEPTAESARRKALEALGLYRLTCDMCGDECWERCQQDDGQWLCIQCVEGLRDDADTLLGIAEAKRNDLCRQLDDTRANLKHTRHAERKLRDDLRDAQKNIDVLRAERDNLRQHTTLTTRGDGFDDLRVRLANAAIEFAEKHCSEEKEEARVRVTRASIELCNAIRAKTEVTT